MCQQKLVAGDRLRKFAHSYEYCRPLRQVGGLIRLLFQQLIDLCECVFEFLPPAEHVRIVQARQAKIRCKLQTSLQQVFGVIINADLQTYLGE